MICRYILYISLFNFVKFIHQQTIDWDKQLPCITMPSLSEPSTVATSVSANRGRAGEISIIIEEVIIVLAMRFPRNQGGRGGNSGVSCLSDAGDY